MWLCVCVCLWGALFRHEASLSLFQCIICSVCFSVEMDTCTFFFSQWWQIIFYLLFAGIFGMSCRCHSFLHPCLALNGLGLTKLSQVFQSLQSDEGLHSLSCWVQEHGKFKVENVDKFPKFIHIIATTDWNCIPPFRWMTSSHRSFYCHIPRDVIHNMPLCWARTFFSCHASLLSDVLCSLPLDIYFGSPVVPHFSIVPDVFTCVNICHIINILI
jgi:hypothetical protein